MSSVCYYFTGAVYASPAKISDSRECGITLCVFRLYLVRPVFVLACLFHIVHLL